MMSTYTATCDRILHWVVRSGDEEERIEVGAYFTELHYARFLRPSGKRPRRGLSVGMAVSRPRPTIEPLNATTRIITISGTLTLCPLLEEVVSPPISGTDRVRSPIA